MTDTSDRPIAYKPSDGISYDPAEPRYWQPAALAKEVQRAFEICHGCRMWFKYCVTDVAALGENVNITARLASKAAPGEALISDTTYTAAGLELGDLEQRQLELKGKS